VEDPANFEDMDDENEKVMDSLSHKVEIYNSVGVCSRNYSGIK